MNFAIQVRMTEKMYNKVEAKAKLHKVSTAEILRKLINEHTK